MYFFLYATEKIFRIFSDIDRLLRGIPFSRR